MITLNRRSWNGIETVFPPRQFANPYDALIMLVEVDLMWGGAITCVTQNSLGTRTSVLGCVDLCVYEGPDQEISILRQVAQIHRQKVADFATEMAERKRRNDSSPKKGRRISKGDKIPDWPSAKRAVIEFFGLTMESDIKAAQAAEVKDIVAAALLSQECGISFGDVIRL